MLLALFGLSPASGIRRQQADQHVPGQHNSSGIASLDGRSAVMSGWSGTRSAITCLVSAPFGDSSRRVQSSRS
ncbi:MAG: hypothetical protein JWR01_1028 [Subtercola sp.]|nr:hypothetical protein [Subtercola sp.]